MVPYREKVTLRLVGLIVTGTFLYSNGDKYQGGFKQGKMHGKGVYVCANGDETQGTN
jgi:hypothetical protein